MTCHPDIYKKWGDKLIKTRTLENWSRWEEEKPAWFTDAWIDGVDHDFIPFEFRVKYKKTKGRVDDDQLKKRKGCVSVRDLIGGKENR